LKRSVVGLAMLGAIVGGAVSGPLVRLALALPSQPSPILIAAARQCMAAVVMLVVCLSRPEWRAQMKLQRRDILPVGVAGVLLGINFITWNIAAGSTTSFAASLFLSSITLFVGLGAWAMGEKPGWRFAAGCLIALPGMLLMAGGGGDGEHSLRGDLYALATALALTIYMLCGRRVRKHMHLVPYTAWIYTISAVVLLAALPAMPGPTGPLGWQFFGLAAAMVLLCTFGNHSLTNFVLGHRPAHVAGMMSLGEPPVAALFGFIFFAQVPTGWAAVGGGVALIGLLVAVWPKPEKAIRQPFTKS